MDHPLVSIVVATYRRREPLKNALASLGVQTYKNIEIIVVDDNADKRWNESVSKVVSAFMSEFPDVKITLIINSENKGSAESRNIGIDSSKGEYVTFLDDDDVYHPEKVERQLNCFILKDGDYGITDLYLYSQNGKLIDRRVRFYIKKYDPASLTRYHMMYHLTGTDTMMFKKSYLLKIGCFDPIDVGDEYYLMQKAISGGGKFVYLPECHVKAYVHTGKGGLSSGERKINGENDLFKYKSTFFNTLDKKTVQYIKVRHYSVLAYAYMRSGRFFGFAKNSLCGIFISPFIFLKIMRER